MHPVRCKVTVRTRVCEIDALYEKGAHSPLGLPTLSGYFLFRQVRRVCILHQVKWPRILDWCGAVRCCGGWYRILLPYAMAWLSDYKNTPLMYMYGEFCSFFSKILIFYHLVCPQKRIIKKELYYFILVQQRQLRKNGSGYIVRSTVLRCGSNECNVYIVSLHVQTSKKCWVLLLLAMWWGARESSSHSPLCYCYATHNRAIMAECGHLGRQRRVERVTIDLM